MSDMNCIECAEWLHPYLDNELGTELAARIHAHLRHCTSCKAQYESLRVMQAGLRQQAPYYEMPELLQRRILAKLPAARNKQWIAPAISFAALAASVMLFVGAPSSQDELVTEVVASHVRSLQEQHLMDVVSTDKHTVKPWFAGKLDFSPPVVDLKDQGYPLMGGRLDYIDHQNAAALAYHHNKHVINLFVIPTTEADTTPSTHSQRGYNIVSWRKNHMKFEAVSDLNAQELDEFSQMVAEHS
jgi:anti-sigma factor RsiW